MNLEAFGPSGTNAFAVGLCIDREPQIISESYEGGISAVRDKKVQKRQFIASRTAKHGKYKSTFRDDCRFMSAKISQLGLQIINEMESHTGYIYIVLHRID